MFLEFSIKNRIDVVENMPLVFNVFNRTFTTIIGDIEDNIKHFFEVSGYSKMIYFFQKIDPINNEITFFWRLGNVIKKLKDKTIGDIIEGTNVR